MMPTFAFTKAFVLMILAAGSVLSHQAVAMTLVTPTGVHSSIDSIKVIDDVACWPWGAGGWGWYPPGYPRSWALNLRPCSLNYYPPSYHYRRPHGRPYLRPGWWW